MCWVFSLLRPRASALCVEEGTNWLSGLFSQSMSSNRRRGRPEDDPDSLGPASSATSAEEAPRHSSDQLETEDNPQVREEEQESATSSDQQQRLSLRHNVAGGSGTEVLVFTSTVM